MAVAHPQPEAFKVLIVEDEGRLRELLSRAIVGMGFGVSVARSGEEAIRLMDQDPHPILLLDLNLPAMSGMDVFQAVRQRWPATQVIVLTGFGDLQAAKDAIRLDVVDFLTKPCPLGELEVSLDRARRRYEEAQAPDSPPVPPEVILNETGSPPTLSDLERQHILATLTRNKGNRSATATELGISLRTLYYRLSEYEKQGYRIE